MRKIIESTLISLDGVVNDPGSWALDYFNDEFLTEAFELLQGCDAMLMGRGTYEDLSWRWPGQKGDFADAINGIRKYVFSSKLQRTEWNNSVVVDGDVVAEVRKLKEESGGDLVVFGHGMLSHTLLEHGLLDRLRFAVHPIVVGQPLGPFVENPKTPLTLVSTHARRSGVVVLNYTVQNASSSTA
ncbi:dihydrofolate reductase family protein [Actinomadura rudentiformis]|uniref:Dihydrofolate reductase family protein n=1 Tax=Actinomadura rudentiformis TaxID=359158 RepID=A0A6H9YYQ4_9ACTN|nr:dihydrofolate reductase family protein [Actinomadura rudentiformis]KAB2350289.1 dihydrofolate reductase family protein [Actinomadura rudentiformis]